MVAVAGLLSISNLIPNSELKPTHYYEPLRDLLRGLTNISACMADSQCYLQHSH